MKNVTNINKRIFLILVFWLSISSLLASEPIVFSNPNELLSIGKEVYILEDKTNQLTIDDVINSKDFVKSEQEVPNLGVTKSSIWVKFTLLNQSSGNDILLNIAYPLLDEAELFFPNNKNASEYDNNFLGKHQEFSKRKYNNPNYIFDIHLPKDVSKTYYLRVKNTKQIILPISISSHQILWENIVIENLITGIYIGIILIMFFYNLFIYFSVRDKSYLYYIMYICFAGFTQVGINGLTFQYLWPGQISFEVKSFTVFASLAGIGAVLFTQSFLDLKKFVKKSRYALDAFIFLFLGAILSTLLGFHSFGFQLMQLASTLTTILIPFISYIVIFKGYRPAIFFSIAWTVLIIGVIIFLLKEYDIIPYNIITNSSIQISTAIEMTLFSFALADRINILKRERVEALAANQQLIIDQNVILEKKVEVRTLEIEQQKQVIEAQRVKEVNSLRFKALTGQMKPHFVFNSLNSIRCFVLNNEPLKADLFLIKFARLMRSMLDNSREDYCTLSDEVEALENYLALEKLRFENKFDYTIQVDSAIDSDDVKIPSFLIQPYVENAILHGVANKSNGTIKIMFKTQQKGIVCVIEDNGVGRTSGDQPVKEYKSVGMSITKARLAAIGSYSGVEIIDLKDENGSPSGTKVEVQIEH